MSPSTAVLSIASYSVAAAAFLGLAVLLIINWHGRLQGSLFILACLATTAWTGVIALDGWHGADLTTAAASLEILRSIAWIAFLWSMLDPGQAAGSRAWRGVAVIAVAASVFIAAAGYGALVAQPGLGAVRAVPFLRLILAVIGGVLTETLFHNTTGQQRWSNKFLCLATGSIFVYDLFFHADAILLNRLDPGFASARGLVQLLVAPMLAIAAVRNEMWKTNIAPSRKVVFYSTTLISSGVYLFLMSAVGFYLRSLDENLGTSLQVIFLFGAIVVLLIVLFSGTSRAHLRVLISKHFFKHRYDYREEWLRFMRTVSVGQTQAALEERAIRAIADVVDSPGGAIWLADADRYVMAASWNMAIDEDSNDFVAPMAQFLRRTQWVIDIRAALDQPTAYEGLTIPEALARNKRAWLIIPLWHHSLTGFILLAKPRAPRKIGWEDFDLLKTFGKQTASYVAEQRAARALAEAREFDVFNRRFAFVLHDIKNLVSQLSLVASNFERHADNKAFRDDMMETVKDAIAKMKHLTDKIHSQQVQQAGEPIIHPVPIIRSLIAARAAGSTPVHFDCAAGDVGIAGDVDRLTAVLNHLIQNAIDATGADGSIRVSLRKDGYSAVIEITDDGPGMSPDFIRRELFKPFRSTKETGLGIGMFQCREYTRDLGGRLDVASDHQLGTTMRITLPIAHSAPPPAPAPAQTHTLPEMV